MCGHGHHRAGAIAHQYEVSSEYWNQFASDGMDGVDAEWMAFLFHRLDFGLGGAALTTVFNESGNVRIVSRHAMRQRMLGGDRDIGHAH